MWYYVAGAWGGTPWGSSAPRVVGAAPGGCCAGEGRGGRGGRAGARGVRPVRGARPVAGRGPRAA